MAFFVDAIKTILTLDEVSETDLGVPEISRLRSGKLKDH